MLQRLILLAVFLVLTQQHEEESLNIVELNATTFKSTISQYKTSSVLFFAPWCGHCKHIMPEYEQTCKEVNTLYPGSILCARLDCTKNEAICTEHQLQGFPTLKILRDSYECAFNGERTKDSILSWIKSAHNSIREINDLKELNELFGSYKDCIVGYFTDTTHPMRKLMEQLVCNMPSLSVLSTSNKEFADKHAIQKENSIYLFREGKFIHQIEQVANVSEIILALFFHLNALVPEYNHKNVQVVFNQAVTKYVAFVYNVTENLSSIKNVIEDFAKDHFGKVRMFTIDGSDENNVNVVTYFKIKSFPKIVFYDDEIQKFYHFEKDSEVNLEKLNKFLSGCLDGTIKPYIKKQPIPEDWDKTNVKQLVVDNFDQIFEKYQSGVVLFYASWCSHCEALMPTWFKIADDLAILHPNIFIAKLDHVENDISGITIEGYPTVYAYKSRNEKVLYEGERNYDEIKEFIIKTLELQKVDPVSKEEHSEL